MCGTVLTFLFLAPAVPAIAQTPAAEISGGWSFLVDGFQNHPLGFQVGGGLRLTDSLALVGDLGWNRSTERSPDFEFRQSLTTFSVGPRFYFGERVTAFTHVLVGVIRVNRTVREPELNLGLVPDLFTAGSFDLGVVSFPSEGAQSAFMIQPGGGADVHVSRHLAIRLEGDYRWINEAFFSAANEKDSSWNLRFIVGGVLYLGQH